MAYRPRAAYMVLLRYRCLHSLGLAFEVFLKTPSLHKPAAGLTPVHGRTWHLTDVTSRAADVGSSRYSGHHDSVGSHPTPACSATKVTLAPTYDGALRTN
jgi:hypothetical protein